ncbi:MAG TPA: SPFH domain-containing protein, partial [Phycisphaerae bacterium]|nr:SPFH domain-containing protein [Phycisphaerae bacterium]
MSESFEDRPTRVPPVSGGTGGSATRALAQNQERRAAMIRPPQAVSVVHRPTPQQVYNSTGGFSMILALMFLVGLAMAVLPLVQPYVPALTPLAAWIFSIFGFATLATVAIISIYARLYRRAAANLAYVRTGGKEARVIKDGGMLVIPVLHQITPVSLETMRLNVERRGTHALITKDNLRVDLSAEFYIKVQANTEDIIQAARSLGGRNVQPDVVSELVQEKLVSALRTVAATRELVDLHSKRDEFATAVQQIVIHDLAHNGLTLESVTISSLDQTDPTQLQERNVFDAQGLRKIAEITQKARVERNVIEREAEQAIAGKNVETRKQVLEMARDQAEAEAAQKMQVANIQAGREREIAEFKIQQDEAVAKRDIEKQRQVQTAEVARKLSIEQAEVDKLTVLIGKTREREQAEILKQQAIEVAHRQKEAAVAAKEKEAAEARAAALEAEAHREKASQAVVTVTVTSEAEREAAKKLIAARQEAEQNKVKEQTNADVLAYMRLKEADAERGAAQAMYEAKLRLAEGDAAGATKRAEGEKALKMVDVNVEREKVNVEKARVDVERVSLSNKQEFEGAALQFELEKLRIQADKEVRIAAAQAMANMFAKAQMQIFGDPSTMASMSQQFMKAAGYGAAAEGLMQTLPPEAKSLLANLGNTVVSQMAAKQNGGKKDVPPAVTRADVKPTA